jgi:hypothetical protein
MPLKPAHELYGELLLKAGKTEEAGRQFKLAFERAPGRALSRRGLAQAEASLFRGSPALEGTKKEGTH